MELRTGTKYPERRAGVDFTEVRKKGKSIEGIFGEKTSALEFIENYDAVAEQITKEIRNWPFVVRKKEVLAEFGKIRDKELLEKEMKEAAKNLDFERAAQIRDLIRKLKSGKSKLYDNY